MKIDLATSRRVMNILHALQVRLNMEFVGALEPADDGGVPVLMGIPFLGKMIWLPVFAEPMEDGDGEVIEPQTIEALVDQACENIEAIIEVSVGSAELSLIQHVLAKREAETDILLEDGHTEPSETPPEIIEV